MRKPTVLESAFAGLGINFAFGIYNAVLGILDKSFWFLALSAYFIVLGVMRFSVILYSKKSERNNFDFIKRFCGFMLIILGITTAGITYIAVSEKMGTIHGEIIMITIATYSFTKIVLAIINLVKANKTSYTAVKILRNISLADAAVSIFSLQRSMLVSFEGMTEENIFLMNCLTGTAVYLFIFLLGINLIGGQKVTMAKSKMVEANKKLAVNVKASYKKIEDTVVSGYKKIENATVSGYTKIEDKFVEKYLIHDGETLEEAKKRLKK